MNPEQRFRRAARRYRDTMAKAEAARAELREAMIEARESGMTLQGMADVLGVTRQRVADILRER